MIGLLVMYLFPNPELNLFLYPFVVAGYTYKENETKISVGKKKLAWLAVPIWFLFLIFFKERHYIYTSGITLWISKYGIIPQIGIDIFRYGIGLVGCIATILIIENIGKKWKMVSAIGRYSLQIYVMQCFTMKVFTLVYEKLIIYLKCNLLTKNMLLFDVVITPIMATVTIAVLIGVASVIKKISWLNKICFGK